jgi:predicted kinase
MNRFVIMTVGKTHSGKTTFAKALEKKLPHSVVIDQDNHAAFLQAHYSGLLPADGPNFLKYTLTRTIVDYAVNETTCHVILCNSNRQAKSRSALLKEFQQHGFTSMLIHFAIPDPVLEKRVLTSKRPIGILRTASSFEEVLNRQHAELHMAPNNSEADYLFTLTEAGEMESLIQKILAVISGSEKK